MKTILQCFPQKSTMHRQQNHSNLQSNNDQLTLKHVLFLKKQWVLIIMMCMTMLKKEDLKLVSVQVMFFKRM